MSKWRHNDGAGKMALDAYHNLLETLERELGELGSEEELYPFSASYEQGHLTVCRGGSAIRVAITNTQFGRRTCDWLYDAVAARKAIRKRRNDPTFGATK